MNSSEKELLLRLLDALLPGVKVYLFGSRAWGTPRERSDFDLALDAGRELSISEIARARNITELLYVAEKIDVVDLHSVSSELRKKIQEQGVLWKN